MAEQNVTRNDCHKRVPILISINNKTKLLVERLYFQDIEIF